MDTINLHHYKPDFLRRIHWHAASWAIAGWCVFFAASLADRSGGQLGRVDIFVVLRAAFTPTFVLCGYMLFYVFQAIFDKLSDRTYSVHGRELRYRSTRNEVKLNLASAKKVVVRRRQSGEIAVFKIWTEWWRGWFIFGQEDMNGLLEKIKGVIPDDAKIVEKRLLLDLESPWNVVAWGLVTAIAVYSLGMLFYGSINYLLAS